MSAKFSSIILVLTLLLTSTPVFSDVIIEIGKGEYKEGDEFGVSMTQITLFKRIYNSSKSDSIDIGLSFAKGDNRIDVFDYEVDFDLFRTSFNVFKNTHIAFPNGLSMLFGAGISANKLKAVLESYDSSGKLDGSTNFNSDEISYGFKIGAQYSKVSITSEIRFYPNYVNVQEGYINIGLHF